MKKKKKASIKKPKVIFGDKFVDTGNPFQVIIPNSTGKKVEGT